MKTSSKIRLLVVDDHFTVRMGLTASINMESDLEVVAEASTFHQAIKEYRKCQPDVVLLDYCLPGASGVEVLEKLKSEFPAIRVIIFSSFSGDENIHRSIQAGARAYLLKSGTRAELLKAIRVVYAGERYLPQEVAAELAHRLNRSELSERELNVLRLVAQGKTNKEIAMALDIAEITVKQHVGHILSKLGASDRTQAATVALRRGIISLD
jgi:two-component system, NarL family, response regulator